MAGFVDCSVYRTEQEAQNKAISNLAADNDKLSDAVVENKKAIDNLANSAITADSELLDESGGRGKITVEKIKEAIKGDVEISVDPNSGITGNGTKDSPLGLKLDNSLSVGKDGSIGVSTDNLKEALGGVRLVDASGTVVLGKIQGV